ncbi:hypothetical protein EMIT079MI2_20191 [Bacillus sp. IT-79MI2]
MGKVLRRNGLGGRARLYKKATLTGIADGYVEEKSRCTYSFPSIMSKNILQRRLGR